MGEEEIVPASPVISSAKRRGARRHARVRGRSKEGRGGREGGEGGERGEGGGPLGGEADSSGGDLQEDKGALVEEASREKEAQEPPLKGVEELPALGEERSTEERRGGGESTIQWTESLGLEVSVSSIAGLCLLMGKSLNRNSREQSYIKW